ncbi:amidase [Nocardioides sp. GY 10113]|uniref:amidase n=1 Tax=Nocardioides sp. GY 10113 TaxID=2569761 RepID=UPI0010A91603|nr:amidase [Nocardioides sp. GY 10113]TIC89306.1 amidase [Nocardioides sp. GY 10113]
MTRVHAFTDDALGDDDTVGLVARLRARKVSPGELVEASIARMEKLDAALGGLAYAAFDEARRESVTRRDGFFAGIPTLVKDNCDVAGMPTQHGTDAFTARRAEVDGEFARTYRATGMLVLGKSQLSEFGFSAAAEHPRLGPVRNPWDPDHIAGASSAGAAAFVAGGAVPIAHANDGGGSIRIPAHACGLVGLKPTRGRVPQDALHRQMPVRIVADGVLTRSVRDTAAFLRESEKHYRRLDLPPIGDITRPSHRRLKVAFVTSWAGRGATPEVREQVVATAALLEELGHHVTEIAEQDVPVGDTFADDFLLYWGFLAMVVVRSGRWTFDRSWDASRCDHLTLGLARYAARRLHRLPAAIARLRSSQRQSRRFFAGQDVILTPTVASPTPRIGHLDPTQDFDTVLERLLDWVAFTPLQNATGDPSLSLPLATSASGLPQGMCFSAAAGGEATLLGLAYELERARPWARVQD